MAGKVALEVSDAELPAETVRTLNEKYGCHAARQRGRGSPRPPFTTL
ncbi:hypothetical protein AB0J28_42630 [Streptosporangium canum]